MKSLIFLLSIILLFGCNTGNEKENTSTNAPVSERQAVQPAAAVRVPAYSNQMLFDSFKKYMSLTTSQAAIIKVLQADKVKYSKDMPVMSADLKTTMAMALTTKADVSGLRAVNVGQEIMNDTLLARTNKNFYYFDGLNTRQYQKVRTDSVNNAALKAMIEQRSKVLRLTDFTTVGDTTGLNFQSIIDRLKVTLKLP